MGMSDMRALLGGLHPDAHRPHALHDPARDWPETNCYVDLWIEVLAALGHDPVAALGFTAAQDFEGDQFTFFKFPPEDLAELFGLRVQELAIYDRLETHIAEQLARGRLALVEVDAFYLPDARGVSYGLEHSKTTIATIRIDVAARRLDYFHNAGYFTLDGADYDGALQNEPRCAELLFPYAEFVKIGRRPETDPRHAAHALLRKHVALAPQANPVRAFAARLRAESGALAARDPAFFHKYAFNTLRQLGANFALLGDHLAWLAADGREFADPVAACAALSVGAKSFQFQLARAMARRRVEAAAAPLDELAAIWDKALGGLRAALA
jgi:hypothetical protein